MYSVYTTLFVCMHRSVHAVCQHILSHGPFQCLIFVGFLVNCWIIVFLQGLQYYLNKTGKKHCLVGLALMHKHIQLVRIGHKQTLVSFGHRPKRLETTELKVATYPNQRLLM